MRKPFSLTKKQDEAIGLFASLAMYVLLYGGARSTKTFTIIRTIVLRALAAPGSRHAIVRFRFNHVKASVVYDTFPKVMDLCFPGCPYKLNKEDWFAKLPNGSEIWFGGLDDKERTEKILGNEYVSIFMNECSQISYGSFLIMITRLAQKVSYTRDGVEHEMRLRMFMDENPPMKGHWTYKLFMQGVDPDTKKGLAKPESYVSLLMNPTDNTENLPGAYLEALDSLPKRQRDRFLLGLFGDETENSLWTLDVIEKSRVGGDDVPDFVRVVVAVDPSGADDDENKNNDEIGIGVIGLGTDGCAYVLEDLTIKAGPATWGEVATGAYERHQADRIVGESNYGGAMVEFVIKTANPNAAYKAVTASRGKVVRAEPASALHETGKIKFVGEFPELEDELLAFTTTGYTGARSPNRADWFVWGITELFPAMTKPVKVPKPPINVPNMRRAS
ncbi:MAG: phage terminase large subunit [Rhodospirillaceae bacterium]|nr:phage terminase large subunit [Rhodospirillaceae bacterium]